MHNAHYSQKEATAEIALPALTETEINQIREYFGSLIQKNATRAAQIKSVKLVGGSHMRDSFIEANLEDLFRPNHNLKSLLDSVDTIQTNLQSFGIFDNISMHLDEASRGFPFGRQSPVLDLNATLYLQESKRFVAKTGTDLGNGEGSGYMNGTFKNAFGGAEVISLDATMGTRTKSSYIANLTLPTRAFGKWYLSETLAFVTSRNIAWASHEQFIRGVSTKLKSSSQELGGEYSWRSIQCEDSASDSVRNSSGHSMKSSIHHSWVPVDTRDDAFMPSKGIYLKISQELGNAASTPFYKASFESNASKSITERSIVTASLKAGALLSKKSHIMDRFFLGGPNDVRGFYLNSMGPRDSHDSLGGDFFYAFGLGALMPIPKIAKTHPLKFQTFVNGGFLSSDPKIVGIPSLTAGIGLVYRAPMARFELNFSLPLVVRANESPRKGIQFGVGFSFM